MTTTKTYIYAEPDAERVTAYIDQTGKYHFTREEAIAANVQADLLREITVAIVPAITDDAALRAFASRKMLTMLKQNRELVEAFYESLD